MKALSGTIPIQIRYRSSIRSSVLKHDAVEEEEQSRIHHSKTNHFKQLTPHNLNNQPPKNRSDPKNPRFEELARSCVQIHGRRVNGSKSGRGRYEGNSVDFLQEVIGCRVKGS